MRFLEYLKLSRLNPHHIPRALQGSGVHLYSVAVSADRSINSGLGAIYFAGFETPNLGYWMSSPGHAVFSPSISGCPWENVTARLDMLFSKSALSKVM
jgi:hypothetical protein